MVPNDRQELEPEAGPSRARGTPGAALGPAAPPPPVGTSGLAAVGKHSRPGAWPPPLTPLGGGEAAGPAGKAAPQPGTSARRLPSPGTLTGQGQAEPGSVTATWRSQVLIPIGVAF